jgi:hypothetical protein
VTLCLRKEGLQHFWCSEAQPPGNVQEVQPATQQGVHLGFVKPSECRKDGEHIAILRLLRLKNAFTATILSKEFIDLRVFNSVCQVLMNPDFWKWAFVMCRALSFSLGAEFVFKLLFVIV